MDKRLVVIGVVSKFMIPVDDQVKRHCLCFVYLRVFVNAVVKKHEILPKCQNELTPPTGPYLSYSKT